MGRFPFRRTFEFLSSGNLVLKSNVKTVLINYTHCKESLGLRYAKINFQYSYFRYGKTGDKNVQLVLQHCCKTSWKAMLRVLPPTNQTCVACTKQAVPTTGSPSSMSLLDCEQSLIFPCKVTARETPLVAAACREKRGRNPRGKNKRLLTLLFCLGTTKLSRKFN